MSKKDKTFFETLSLEIDESTGDGGSFTIDLSDAQTVTIGEIEETGESRPNHYSQDPNSVECIEVIKQLCKEHQNDPFTDYNRYQAFKYLWRLGKKDDVLFDLNKAITFLVFARDALEEERNG
jgi:hypothetical protein